MPAAPPDSELMLKSIEETYIASDSNVFTQFEEALKKRDVKQLKLWVEENSQIVSRPYGKKMGTPLHAAVDRGDREAVAVLLAAGADTKLGDAEGRTAVHAACQHGNPEIGKILFQRVSLEVLRSPDRRGDEPLHVAARAGHVAMVQALQAAGVPLSATGENGNTALHCAASDARVEVVRLLLAAGQHPDCKNCRQETPLHLVSACFARGLSRQVAELLLEAGASLDARTSTGDTAAHYAARAGPVCLLRFLVERGISVSKPALNTCSEDPEMNLSLLSKVARSQCIEKSEYVLEQIVQAKMQKVINSIEPTEEDIKSLGRDFFKVVELTDQQLELLELGEELKQNITDPDSPIQNFLKYSPDALCHYFDKCLFKPVDCQVQGDVFFCLSLFEPDPWKESELDIISVIVAAKKEKMLLHPLFDIFLKLKMKKVGGMFWIAGLHTFI